MFAKPTSPGQMVTCANPQPSPLSPLCSAHWPLTGRLTNAPTRRNLSADNVPLGHLSYGSKRNSAVPETTSVSSLLSASPTRRQYSPAWLKSYVSPRFILNLACTPGHDVGMTHLQ